VLLSAGSFSSGFSILAFIELGFNPALFVVGASGVDIVFIKYI
jgi:hypothetical protein